MSWEKIKKYILEKKPSSISIIWTGVHFTTGKKDYYACNKIIADGNVIYDKCYSTGPMASHQYPYLSNIMELDYCVEREVNIIGRHSIHLVPCEELEEEELEEEEEEEEEESRGGLTE
ncbi:MAG: hypothetical protein N3F67_06305 [Acidilobaceae archaeon]|nr:hypothetical protein [Acidilobaceae archaeon]